MQASSRNPQSRRGPVRPRPATGLPAAQRALHLRAAANRVRAAGRAAAAALSPEDADVALALRLALEDSLADSVLSRARALER